MYPSVTAIPDVRIRTCNSETLRDGDFVLYWMIACRRAALQLRARARGEQRAPAGKPLVVLEPLRCGYRWASDRIHRFVLDGMADNARAPRAARASSIIPTSSPSPGAGKGLLEALAARACLVVTDDYPASSSRAWSPPPAARLPVRLEAVDSTASSRCARADRSYHDRLPLPALPPEGTCPTTSEHAPAPIRWRPRLPAR